MTRTTHTYAILEVTPMAFVEIRRRLEVAGYDHALQGDECAADVLALLPPEGQ